MPSHVAPSRTSTARGRLYFTILNVRAGWAPRTKRALKLAGLGTVALAMLALGIASWIDGWQGVRAWDNEWAKWQSVEARPHCDSETLIEITSYGVKHFARKGCSFSYVADGRLYITKETADEDGFGPLPKKTRIYYKKDSPSEIAFGWCGNPYMAAQNNVSAGRVLAGIGLAGLVGVFFLTRRAGRASSVLPQAAPSAQP
ncbi:MAG TPA: hypothetical protein VJ723_06985 [Candidatus Angelobacter sp.]|nr:hypothetical protein [Candidatus Angelobacter sp.]